LTGSEPEQRPFRIIFVFPKCENRQNKDFSKAAPDADRSEQEHCSEKERNNHSRGRRWAQISPTPFPQNEKITNLEKERNNSTNSNTSDPKNEKERKSPYLWVFEVKLFICEKEKESSPFHVGKAHNQGKLRRPAVPRSSAANQERPAPTRDSPTRKPGPRVTAPTATQARSRRARRAHRARRSFSRDPQPRTSKRVRNQRATARGPTTTNRFSSQRKAPTPRGLPPFHQPRPTANNRPNSTTSTATAPRLFWRAAKPV
jgi:hypothetical protein